MRITIPGRPQSKDRGHDGRLLDAAKAYLDAVRTAARDVATAPHDHGVRLDLNFIYTAAEPLPITEWPRTSIPNGDTAQTLALRALVGVLVHHRTQFNPVTITRTVLHPTEAQALYGDPTGATIITWEPA